jgi:hypothetical protein
VKAKNRLMHCRMADDSVVVIKFRPMKASNGVEEKTGMTLYLLQWGMRDAKSAHTCEGMKFKRRSLEVLKKISIETQSG